MVGIPVADLASPRGRSSAADVAGRHLAAVPEEPTRPPLTVVYGGGLQFGIAYGLGVADALLEVGVPLRHVDALGVSAGSWVAACLATGVTLEVLGEIPQVRVPDPRPGALRRIARAVFGSAMDARVRVAAVQLPTLRRRILSGARFPLADLVAASSSVPGVFAPSPVGRGLYIDGMARRGMGADQAPAAHHLLVVAPLAGPMFGPGGRLLELLQVQELRRWARSTGGSVHLIRPNRAIARLVRHPLDLLDQRRASREVYPMAFEQTIQLLGARPALAGLAAADWPGKRTVSPLPAGDLLRASS